MIFSIVEKYWLSETTSLSSVIDTTTIEASRSHDCREYIPQANNATDNSSQSNVTVIPSHSAAVYTMINNVSCPTRACFNNFSCGNNLEAVKAINAVKTQNIPL